MPIIFQDYEDKDQYNVDERQATKMVNEYRKNNTIPYNAEALNHEFAFLFHRTRTNDQGNICRHQ